MTLTRIVSWSHRLAREILRPGDLAIDLTAGRGRDTCMLAEAVGPTGRVLAYDIQHEALTATARALREIGREPACLSVGQPIPSSPGIFLCEGCHGTLADAVAEGAKVVMANLGYLPGGDPQVTTRDMTTLAALERGLKILEVGGRLIVTVYTGHPGGAEEEVAVNKLLGGLPGTDWQVLQIRVVNHIDAPAVFVAEKKG